MNSTTYKIAIIIETINSYGQGIVRGIYRFLKSYPGQTLFFEERTLDSPPPAWLADWQGDGIIVRDKNGKSCDLALRTGAKIVDLSECRHPGIPTVYSNYTECSRLAAEHLLQRGLSHFAFVGIKGRPFSQKRCDAFLRAVGDADVFEIQDNELAFASWGNDYSKLIDWLRRLPKPVGIMTCYDMPGIGVLQACRLAGINVPDEVAVIGVNNDELHCNMAIPSLSSVAQNQERVGYEACDLLFGLLENRPDLNIERFVSPLGVIARTSTDILLIPDVLVLRAVKRIREQACSGLEVNDLAQGLNISRRTLERRFVKIMSRTPHEEIVRTRITRAKELLIETTLPLQVVAKKVGIKSLHYFTKLFIRETGIRPVDFRRKNSRIFIARD